MGDGIQERKGIQIRKLTSCRRNNYIVYKSDIMVSKSYEIYLRLNKKLWPHSVRPFAAPTPLSAAEVAVE